MLKLNGRWRVLTCNLAFMVPLIQVKNVINHQKRGKMLNKKIIGKMFTQFVSPEQKFQKELDLYKSSTRLDFEEDPLIWWKHNCLKLPIMSQLARKYLCVCATSTSSERLFSAAGNVVTP